MIPFRKIFLADFFKLSCNRVLMASLLLPIVLSIYTVWASKDAVLHANELGLDPWPLLLNTTIAITSLILPLLAIVYPYIMMDNEHQNNGFRTHAILPVYIHHFFISKLIWLMILLFIVILSCGLVFLNMGYFIGFKYHIKEFVLYSPTVVYYYMSHMFIVCSMLVAVQMLFNIFIHNFTISTLPSLLLLLVSIFATKAKWKLLNIYVYPHLASQNALQHGDFFSTYFDISIIIILTVALFTFLFLPKLRFLWIK